LLYRLYIDESGDHTYGKKVCRELKLENGTKVIASIPNDDYPDLETENRRYLALLGCIIESKNYKERFYPALSTLKSEVFDEDPDIPVIFHREEIIKKCGYFGELVDPDTQMAFNERILRFIKEMSYKLI
jgi:hypothetical protein